MQGKIGLDAGVNPGAIHKLQGVKRKHDRPLKQKMSISPNRLQIVQNTAAWLKPGEEDLIFL